MPEFVLQKTQRTMKSKILGKTNTIVLAGTNGNAVVRSSWHTHWCIGSICKIWTYFLLKFTPVVYSVILVLYLHSWYIHMQILCKFTYILKQAVSLQQKIQLSLFRMWSYTLQLSIQCDGMLCHPNIAF